MADTDPTTGEQIAFLETTISKLESELVAPADIDRKRRNALIFLIEDAHNRVARINRSRARRDLQRGTGGSMHDRARSRCLLVADHLRQV